MVSSETFWDKAAEKYAASPIKDMDAYEATLARVRAYLKPGDKALEIGCGTGTTALKLADTGADITATDISGKMTAIAETKRAEAGVSNVRFVQATVDRHRFEPGAFDAVLAFNLLHLLGDAPAALGEIGRLVKPGGLFISKTACLADRMGYLKMILPVMKLFGAAPADVQFFKTEELDALIEAAGFDFVERGFYSEKTRSRFVVARKR